MSNQPDTSDAVSVMIFGAACERLLTVVEIYNRCPDPDRALELLNANSDFDSTRAIMRLAGQVLKELSPKLEALVGFGDSQ